MLLWKAAVLSPLCIPRCCLPCCGIWSRLHQEGKEALWKDVEGCWSGSWAQMREAGAWQLLPDHAKSLPAKMHQFVWYPGVLSICFHNCIHGVCINVFPPPCTCSKRSWLADGSTSVGEHQQEETTSQMCVRWGAPGPQAHSSEVARTWCTL